MTIRALVVGSVNVDVVLRVQSLPKPGETLLSSSVSRLAGGKGGNQAAALAQLGALTTLVGAVGTDDDGAWSLAQLAAYGVLTGGVEHVALPTGLAVVMVDDAGENLIVVAPGANAMVRPPTDLSGHDVVVAQLEIPPETVAETILRAGRDGVPVVLNAAPTRWLASEVLAGVRVLVVNEIELQALAGRGDPASAAAGLVQAGPAAVVVTRGAAGALVVDADGATYLPAPSVAVVDTTGAGDCFTAALAYGVGLGQPIHEAAAFAVMAASLSVQAEGARGGLPTADEVTRARASAPS